MENAPYPSCHAKSGCAMVWRIQKDDALLISRMAFAIGNEEGKESRI